MLAIQVDDSFVDVINDRFLVIYLKNLDTEHFDSHFVAL